MISKWKDRNAFLIALGCAIGFVIALLPLFIVGNYASPCADDYTYGSMTHAAWVSTGSVWEVLKAACTQVSTTYNTWQGTFSSVFLMALSPVVWSEKGYIITTIIMILSLVIAHFYLFYVLLVKGMKQEKSLWIIVSAAVCFLLVESVHSPVNAFFWFNGSVHYNFMHSCMIGLIGLTIHMQLIKLPAGKITATVIGCILCVLCGGANYSTALCGMVCIVAVLCFYFVMRRSWNYSVLLVPTYAASFVISIVATGNSIRQTNFNKMGVVESILYSFRYWASYVTEWMSVSIVLFTMLLIPVFLMIIRKSDVRFCFPGMVTVVSICVNACLFTPSFYSMGIPGPDRLLNICKYTFILLYLVNVFYWLGYIVKKREKTLHFLQGKILVGYLVVTVGFIGLFFKISGSQALRDYSSYAAYVSMMAGEAQQFRNEYEERLSLLLGQEKDVYLKPYSVKPYLLFFDDIQQSQYDWRNTAVARWYSKDAVHLIQE